MDGRTDGRTDSWPSLLNKISARQLARHEVERPLSKDKRPNEEACVRKQSRVVSILRVH